MARLGTILLACLLVASAPVAAPTSPTTVEVEAAALAKVDRYLAQSRADLGWPGLSAALVQDGEVAWTAGYGTTGTDELPITPRTPFLVASLSKSVTAVAVARLADDGAVDFADPVTDYLPELAPAGDDLTVRDLLYQRSGLTTADGLTVMTDPPDAGLLPNVLRHASHLRPGAGFEYSNANYDALALLVERASGRSYEDYLQAEVFGPLDMVNATTDPQVASSAGLAGGHYHWLIGGYRPHTPPLPSGAVGSYRMFASAEDMAHLLVMHLDDGSYAGEQVLEKPTLELLQIGRPVGQDGGLAYGGGLYIQPAGSGWMAEETAGSTVLEHDGSALGYRAFFWALPEADLGLVLLANANDQADQTRLPRVAFNVQRLLFDAEPGPISGSEPLQRWGKHLFALLVVVQLGLLAASIRPLRAAWRTGSPGRRGATVLWGAIVVDLLAVLAIFRVAPMVGNAPLAVVMLAPDARLIIGCMAVGVVLGLGRLGLLLGAAVRHRHQVRPVASSGTGP